MLNTVPDNLRPDTVFVVSVGDALLPTRSSVSTDEVLEGIPCPDLPTIMVALVVCPLAWLSLPCCHIAHTTAWTWNATVLSDLASASHAL